MWTLDEAVELVGIINPAIRAVDYHVCIGGSLAYKGQSDKDLDLFFIPLNGYKSASRTVVNLLTSHWGAPRALRDSPDYGPDADFHFNEALRFNVGGMRVDVFIQ